MKTKTPGRSLVLAACAAVLCGRPAAANDSPFAELEGKIHEMKAAVEPACKAAEAGREDLRVREAAIVRELADVLKRALGAQALIDYASKYDGMRFHRGRLIAWSLLSGTFESGLDEDSFAGTAFMIATLTDGEALVYKPLFPKDATRRSMLGPSQVTDAQFGAALKTAIREGVIEENARRAKQRPIGPGHAIEFVK